MTSEEEAALEAALIKKRQIDCGKNPPGHSMIRPNPAWPEQCAKCGITRAAKEKIDAEIAACSGFGAGMFP